MIEILVVDDHDLIREAIRMRIESEDDLKIVGESESGKNAIELYRKLKPDIVLMDIVMRDIDGITATKEIKGIDKSAKVVIMTGYASKKQIREAKECGCDGFLYKEAKTEEFLSVLRNVSNGYSVWTKEVLDSLEELDDENDYEIFRYNKRDLDVLTDKELSIIRCKVKGMGYAEIAKELKYSEAYIKQLVKKLRDKLGLEYNSELAVWGAKRGL